MAPKFAEGRFTADLEGDFVVFLLGVRVNRPWKFYKALPIYLGVLLMIRRLLRDPASGLLASQWIYAGGFGFRQYWRSPGQLLRYANAPLGPHAKQWRAYGKSSRASGDVGIWHETYLVSRGAYEAVYVNMPRAGLAAAGTPAPIASKGETSAERLEAVASGGGRG